MEVVIDLNTKVIFENGNVNIELLKVFLNEVNEELTSLRNSGALKTKHNEKVDLIKNFGVKLEGENQGCFYIKVLNEIRKKDSIYVWFETQKEDGTLVINRIPHYYLAGLDKDTIYLNKNVNTGVFLNVYVTYEY